MTQTPSRDWQKDMELCGGFITDRGWSRRDLIAEQPQMTMYWLQEAKEQKERADAAEARADVAETIEKRLLEFFDLFLSDASHLKGSDWKLTAGRLLKEYRTMPEPTLYPDTTATKEEDHDN